MKILGLDLGDVWIGSAISDPLGITCKPYKTVKLEELEDFIETTIKEELIGTVVVGKPITMKGKDSEQTAKVVELANKLEQKFSQVNKRLVKWIMWDERFSSKRASELAKSTKEDKLLNHARAAAFILQTYLDHKAMMR